MAHDPVLKEKAKELFVVNGFSMDTIQTMLPEVSRKTLYNWRDKENWVAERKAQVKTTTDIRREIEAGLMETIAEWRITKNPSLMFAIGKGIAALKSLSTFVLPDEKKEKDDEIKKGLSPENLKKIEEEILNL